VKIAGLIFSFGLAWVTYRFVERPVRRAPRSISIWLILAMAAIATLGLLSKRSILEPRSTSTELVQILKARDDWLSPPEASQPLVFEGQTFWRDGDDKKTALFIGDSNAEQYFPRVNELIKNGRARVSSAFAFFGGCLPIPNVVNRNVPVCADLISKAFAFAKTSDVATVVVAAQWFYIASEPYDFVSAGTTLGLTEDPRREAAFASLRDELIELRRLGKRTIVILNIPVGAAFAPTSRIVRTSGEVKLLPPPRVLANDVLQPYGKIEDQLKKAATESGAEIIDPFKFLCASGECQTSDQAGMPIYKDGVHLKASFVRDHATFIDEVLQ
jgi:hypothetical protein